MINPIEMLEKDPTSKALRILYNNVPMADQKVSENEARRILEYFRQCDSQQLVSAR
jgi:cytochrome c